jgi:hypothetical protein
VDADDRVGVNRVGHRGALVDAGPSALSLPRDIALRTPSWFSRARMRSTTSQVNVCSG